MLASRSICGPQRHGRGIKCKATAGATDTIQKTVFIAMNVFKVKPECAEDFENVWKSRESHLKEMPGFVRFALLKCHNVPNKYISQSTWESEEAFRSWTQSQQFVKSHGSSERQDNKRPSVGPMLDGPPSPEFFSSITITE